MFKAIYMYNPYEVSAFCLYSGRTRKASADISQKYLNLPFIGIDYCLCTEIHTQQCRDGGLSMCVHVSYIYTYAICAICLYIHLQNQSLYACFSTVDVLSDLRVAFQSLEFKCLSVETQNKMRPLTED